MTQRRAAVFGVERAALLLLSIGEPEASRILTRMGDGERGAVAAMLANLRSGRSRPSPMPRGRSGPAVAARPEGRERSAPTPDGAEGVGPDRGPVVGRARPFAGIGPTPHPRHAAAPVGSPQRDMAAAGQSQLPGGNRPRPAADSAGGEHPGLRVTPIRGGLPRAAATVDRPSTAEATDGGAVPGHRTGILATSAACSDITCAHGAGGRHEPGTAAPPRSIDALRTVDDRCLQAILRSVATDVVAIALRGLPGDIAATVLRNMSKASAAAVRAELELRGPTPLNEVEAARRAILHTASRLAAAGTIVFR
jgi:hypothetical protein